MSLVFAIAVYFICWWMVLFAVLPIGVRTQEEAGEIVTTWCSGEMNEADAITKAQG